MVTERLPTTASLFIYANPVLIAPASGACESDQAFWSCERTRVSTQRRVVPRVRSAFECGRWVFWLGVRRSILRFGCECFELQALRRSLLFRRKTSRRRTADDRSDRPRGDRSAGVHLGDHRSRVRCRRLQLRYLTRRLDHASSCSRRDASLRPRDTRHQGDAIEGMPSSSFRAVAADSPDGLASPT